MATLEEIKLLMKRNPMLASFASRREVKELPNILLSNEMIEQAVYGNYNNAGGLLVLTNLRLIYY